MNTEKVVIGTWPISGDFGRVDLITIQKLLERCYDIGFREFDTAPNYGLGFAEFSLGKVLEDKNDCLINTKMGNSPYIGKSFSISNLKKSVEDSISRLKCDNINVLFLHNPRDEIEDYDEIIALMDTLKTEGKIRYSGLSKAKGVDYESIVDLDHFDFIQDDINLLNIKPISSDLKK